MGPTSRACSLEVTLAGAGYCAILKKCVLQGGSNGTRNRNHRAAGSGVTDPGRLSRRVLPLSGSSDVSAGVSPPAPSALYRLHFQPLGRNLCCSPSCVPKQAGLYSRMTCWRFLLLPACYPRLCMETRDPSAWFGCALLRSKGQSRAHGRNLALPGLRRGQPLLRPIGLERPGASLEISFRLVPVWRNPPGPQRAAKSPKENNRRGLWPPRSKTSFTAGGFTALVRPVPRHLPHGHLPWRRRSCRSPSSA